MGNLILVLLKIYCCLQQWKKIYKSIKNWQSYSTNKSGVRFFGPPCMYVPSFSVLCVNKWMWLFPSIHHRHNPSRVLVCRRVRENICIVTKRSSRIFLEIYLYRQTCASTVGSIQWFLRYSVSGRDVLGGLVPGSATPALELSKSGSKLISMSITPFTNFPPANFAQFLMLVLN